MDELKHCPTCGTTYHDDDDQCSECGHQFNVVEDENVTIPDNAPSAANEIYGPADEEALEVLLSRPGSSAIVESTPAPDAVLDDADEVLAVEEESSAPVALLAAEIKDNVEPMAEVVVATVEEAETSQDEDAEPQWQAQTNEYERTPQNSELPPEVPNDDPHEQQAPLAMGSIDTDPFADTGEHEHTPLEPVIAIPTPTPAHGISTSDEDTAPRPVVEVPKQQFENAHTAPIPSTPAPQPIPRPANVVPAPVPLPTAERAIVPTIPLPPAPVSPPPQVTAARPDYSMQQRISAYAYGGYRLVRQFPNETIMSYGKPLSFFWWIAGSASIVGMMWYFFLLLISGFQSDKVYILLEPDGHVYEEGAGAAHVRDRRTRNARRWGIVGIFMVLISIFTLFVVILAGAIMTDRYVDELNAAYPEFGLFDSDVDPDTLDATQVQNTRVVVLALIILCALALSGFVIGATMSFFGYLQAAAYRIDVAPLPYLR